MAQQYATPSKGRSAGGLEEQQPAMRGGELADVPSTPEGKVTAFISSNAGIEPADETKAASSAAVAAAAGNTVSQEEEAERQRVAMEEHQKQYAENRDALVNAIGKTSGVLRELKEFNKNRWIIHYPELVGPAAASKREQLHSTSSTMAVPKVGEEERPSLARAQTSMGGSTGKEEMSVLKLDLKLGAANIGSPNNGQALVHSLEKSSVAQLLEGRMTTSLRQLASLEQRISDTQSKVLVTGDLNAGKSTFVNALLRRNVMPIDQQPCTTVFCEVLDAADFNDGKEEVHMLRKDVQYDAANESTYTKHAVEDIEDIVAKAEECSPEDAPLLKCYCSDTRSTQQSLLRNGVVDIALIDAPGLNRDSLKTTALFARQEEIDVVVFVVSAENHFTLSAKEFLWNASNDKAYVFIVVNKYDQIKNKEKCKRLVLEQIKQLSPRTYEDAEDLVHFVDSSAVMEREQQDESPSFAQLESALRDFVLQKRSKSKLLPASTYLLRLLFDVGFLAKTNLDVAQKELNDARKALEAARPALELVQKNQGKVEGLVEGEEDGVVGKINQEATGTLTKAVDVVGKGGMADGRPLPNYPGLLDVWTYAQDVRTALVDSLEAVVRSVEDSARVVATDAVHRIREMGESHLPADVEKSQRVFLPEAMFAKRRSKKATHVAGLGLGAELVEVRISDLFDASHHLLVITGQDEETAGGNAKKDHEEEMSLVNSFSVGMGALTLVGGKAFGAKSAVEAFVRVSDMLGSKAFRRWAMPVFVVASSGLVLWTIVDLPNSIPRNVGRSLKRELKSADSKKTAFVDVNAARVSRETRRVLRLAGYDISERFRVAVAQRRAEVEKQEKIAREADEAERWFEKTGKEVQDIRTGVAGLQWGQ